MHFQDIKEVDGKEEWEEELRNLSKEERAGFNRELQTVWLALMKVGDVTLRALE